jgi:hypothetical protein
MNIFFFIFLAWAWLDVDHSPIKRDETILLEPHKPNIDEIILSRSHAGRTYEILKHIYRDKQYKIIPAAGSGQFQIFSFFFIY